MLYFLVDLLALGTINAIMVVGLNIQYGYSGILDLTYYTFVGIGAYIGAVTTMGTPQGLGTQIYILHWSLPWPIAMLLAGLVSAVLGLAMVLIVVRRLQSDYLAIVTVSLGFIIWNFITNYIPLFDGANGLFGVPYLTGGANMSNVQYSLETFAVSVAVLVGCVIVARAIYRSPYGRVLRALREDEIVAESFGKNVRSAKITAFVVSSFMAGVSGALLVYYLTSWNPQAFLPEESFILMAAVIVGGTANYWGSVVGAFLVIELLSEITRYLPSTANGDLVGAGRAVLIGVVLILMLMFRPQGILPERVDKWYRRPGNNRGRPGVTLGRASRDLRRWLRMDREPIT